MQKLLKNRALMTQWADWLTIFNGFSMGSDSIDMLDFAVLKNSEGMNLADRRQQGRWRRAYREVFTACLISS